MAIAIRSYPCPNNDGAEGCAIHCTYGLHDLLPPRRYVLDRQADVSGVSGTGIVAEAVMLHTGQVIVSWLVPPCSMSIHASMADAKAVHGHNGATVFREVDAAHDSHHDL